MLCVAIPAGHGRPHRDFRAVPSQERHLTDNTQGPSDGQIEELKVAIYPTILSGGSGTRLWPLSRRDLPKQFLKLFGDESLLQSTCRRLANPLFESPTVIGNHDHRFLIQEQLAEIGITPRHVVLEPVGRNTAAAAATAALVVAAEDENGLVLLLPSDHIVPDADAFAACVLKGVPAAEQGALVTFGVEPDHPHTGYGYLEIGDQTGEAWTVARFVEKPSQEAAQDYLESGRFLWDAGVFLFGAKQMIAAFEALAPGILRAAADALAKAHRETGAMTLDQEAYESAENISLDYAIMEKADNVRTVLLRTAWSDVGSWSAIWDVLNKDEAGNVAHGPAAINVHGTTNSYAYSDRASVSIVGLDNVVVVATKDAILVASKDSAESVKDLVAALKGGEETLRHTRVYRPWGWYEGLASGERYQVKCLMVKPGGKLSLQSHRHRAEHWVVVQGTASVTLGGETRLFGENESTYIPIGAKHRLANPGSVPALLIEVQSGSYLGEDDIVRYEDIYGRLKDPKDL
ncbi:mannose-1-phosphate guanylyltransferase/mannose-6-phosphate isomerase [Methyloceanibacter methanicus]|uniref:mannose-1-phosphate guanylyltransferase/mannose-6-phosphate isomerase n=1 Tax=Methyloceanibacter methanicus TaxID=1774968 RepID=UPI000B075A88|nr:mannose-1-phosphate guanylyltransferase/mannose-6-phosphate isomerase [Methyloceanibacter methanicus]